MANIFDTRPLNPMNVKSHSFSEYIQRNTPHYDTKYS